MPQVSGYKTRANFGRSGGRFIGIFTPRLWTPASAGDTGGFYGNPIKPTATFDAVSPSKADMMATGRRESFPGLRRLFGDGSFFLLGLGYGFDCLGGLVGGGLIVRLV